jgi:hypothetical protein
MGDEKIEWVDDDGRQPSPGSLDQPGQRRSHRPRTWAFVGIAAVALAAVVLVVATRPTHPHTPVAVAHSLPPTTVPSLRVGRAPDLSLRLCSSLTGTASTIWQPVLDGAGCTIDRESISVPNVVICTSGDLLYASTGPGPGYWGSSGATLHDSPANPAQDPKFTAAYAACEGLDSSSAQASSSPGSRRPVDPSDLAGARVALPHGWVALQVEAFAPPDTEYPTDDWCVAPAGISATDVLDSCPINLQAVSKDRVGTLSPDTPGGFIGDPPEPCAPGVQEGGGEQTPADLPFGGRASLYRGWTFTCSDGHAPAWEQYVVPTEPAFVLYSGLANHAVHNAMAYIAQHSTLPAQSAPLPVFDHGYVRSIERQTNGDYVVRIDRVAEDAQPDNKPTYPYLIPASVMAKAHIRVGDLIDVRTNGEMVTAIGPEFTI